MRVLFLHPAVRVYRLELFERLGAQGVEFLFTSVNSPDTPAGAESARLLRVAKIKFTQCKEIPLLGRRNFSFDLWRVFKFDVIIFSCATSIPFLLLALPLKLLGKRIILFDEMWAYPNGLFVYRMLRPYIRFLVRMTVGAFVAAGSMAARYMREEYNADYRSIQIAFNTTVRYEDPAQEMVISHSAINLKRKLENLGRPVVLYLGRLVKYKGLDVLLTAFAQANIDATILVVGDGPFRYRCEDLCSKLGLANNVIFWGECGDREAPGFYQMANLFVLPARFLPGEAVGSESWGFTVNEALAQGLPVVASDAVGASFDLVKEGVTGWIFSAEDVNALQRILISALSDPDALSAMGSACISRVHDICSYRDNEVAFSKAIGLSQ